MADKANGVTTREEPKSQLAWGIYNFGILIAIAPRRAAAILDIEDRTGQPWKVARRYMEVHKVRVEAYRP